MGQRTYVVESEKMIVGRMKKMRKRIVTAHDNRYNGYTHVSNLNTKAVHLIQQEATYRPW